MKKAYQGQEVEMVDDTGKDFLMFNFIIVLLISKSGSRGLCLNPFLDLYYDFIFAEEILAGSGSGSGDFELETTEYEPKVRIKEDEDEEFFTTQQSQSSTRTPEVILMGSSASTTTMSLTRALIQYILPMVLVWFGGAITNLL